MPTTTTTAAHDANTQATQAATKSQPAATVTFTYSSGEGRALPSASFQTLRIPAAAAAAAVAAPPSPGDAPEKLFSEERSKERRRRHQSSADQGRFRTALAVSVSSCATGSRI